MKKLLRYWYVVIIGGFLMFAAGIYLFFGQNSYIGVHDNLDLFVAQFQMLKNTNTFFAHNVDVPFLGGVSRDSLPSELSLYSLLYLFLPSFAAYIVGYFLKIGIAVVGAVLLARDWYGKQYKEYEGLTLLIGFAYGILNLFPAFGIAFSSIPLGVWLLRRIYKEPGARLYLGLFAYPLLSYFSYFGLFILGYLAVALIWLSIRDRRFSWPLFTALIVLGLGYMGCEYRLFHLMLFGGTETIRASIVPGDLTGPEILQEIADVWKNGVFHADSVHAEFVFPVCMIYFLILNIRYIIKKNSKGIIHDIYNLPILFTAINSVIYGLYNWGAFRGAVEAILPPLKGWQFNRTIFFNPFLWYMAFYIALQRMWAFGVEGARKARGRRSRKKKAAAPANEWEKLAGRLRPWLYRLAPPAAGCAAVIAILVIILSPTRYNDLYQTCHENAYQLFKKAPAGNLSYREFYSTELFEEIKEDIGYDGEWAAAYGFHPAILEYSGIATLDGYLGFYPQSYKEAFRRVIAPALDRVEANRIYYDDWGARAYLYSGTDLSIVAAARSLYVTDTDIYIDTQAFRELGGAYLFSRIELTNAGERGLQLDGIYRNPSSPYTIYLYRTD